MEDLYIRLIDNKPVDFPLIADNLRQVLAVEELTQEVLNKYGYARYERRDVLGYSVISDDGFELCEDNIVRNVLTLEPWTQEQKIDEWVRQPRTRCLYGCDWTHASDSPLSPEKKAEWAKYRQQLRDMPQVYANIQHPNEVVIPIRPI